MTMAKVLRHSWVSSVLILATACGGSKQSSVAFGGGGAPPPSTSGYAAAESAHVSVDRSSSVSAPGGGYIAEPVPDRPGLGTSWGEQVSAPISYAPFLRASTGAWAEVALHYNDAQGVQAHAAYLGRRPAPMEVIAGDGAISVALVDDVGRTLAGYTAGGRSLIIGEDGARYRIVVRNATTARFEIVASVDGLDVIDGRPADPNRRGYIVDPHDTLVIDGFRTSDEAVAAFRFGKVADSYAAQTSGDRNVGVVGLAIFSERGATWTVGELQARDTADPFPQRGYATPPR
jgi:hypothetical protein